jgi:hypothetical protein
MHWNIATIYNEHNLQEMQVRVCHNEKTTDYQPASKSLSRTKSRSRWISTFGTSQNIHQCERLRHGDELEFSRMVVLLAAVDEFDGCLLVNGDAVVRMTVGAVK